MDEQEINEKVTTTTRTETNADGTTTTVEEGDWEGDTEVREEVQPDGSIVEKRVKRRMVKKTTVIEGDGAGDLDAYDTTPTTSETTSTRTTADGRVITTRKKVIRKVTVVEVSDSDSDAGSDAGSSSSSDASSESDDSSDGDLSEMEMDLADGEVPVPPHLRVYRRRSGALVIRWVRVAGLLVSTMRVYYRTRRGRNIGEWNPQDFPLDADTNSVSLQGFPTKGRFEFKIAFVVDGAEGTVSPIHSVGDGATVAPAPRKQQPPLDESGAFDAPASFVAERIDDTHVRFRWALVGGGVEQTGVVLVWQAADGSGQRSEQTFAIKPDTSAVKMGGMGDGPLRFRLRVLSGDTQGKLTPWTDEDGAEGDDAEGGVGAGAGAADDAEGDDAAFGKPKGFRAVRVDGESVRVRWKPPAAPLTQSGVELQWRSNASGSAKPAAQTFDVSANAGAIVLGGFDKAKAPFEFRLRVLAGDKAGTRSPWRTEQDNDESSDESDGEDAAFGPPRKFRAYRVDDTSVRFRWRGVDGVEQSAISLAFRKAGKKGSGTVQKMDVKPTTAAVKMGGFEEPHQYRLCVWDGEGNQGAFSAWQDERTTDNGLSDSDDDVMPEVSEAAEPAVAAPAAEPEEAVPVEADTAERGEAEEPVDGDFAAPKSFQVVRVDDDAVRFIWDVEEEKEQVAIILRHVRKGGARDNAGKDKVGVKATTGRVKMSGFPAADGPWTFALAIEAADGRTSAATPWVEEADEEEDAADFAAPKSLTVERVDNDRLRFAWELVDGVEQSGVSIGYKTGAPDAKAKLCAVDCKPTTGALKLDGFPEADAPFTCRLRVLSGKKKGAFTDWVCEDGGAAKKAEEEEGDEDKRAGEEGADPPSAAKSLRAKDVTDSSLRLVWKHPTNDGGAPIRAYVVQQKSSGGAADDEGGDHAFVEKEHEGAATEHTVDGLQPSTAYTFRVLLVNAAGRSAPSKPLDVTTEDESDAESSDESEDEAIEPPSAAKSVRAKDIKETSLRLVWKHPTNTGGAPISGYIVQQKETGDGDDADDDAYVEVEHDGPGTDVDIDALEPGTPYTFRIVLLNDAGRSAPSKPVHATTEEEEDEEEATVPGAPHKLAVVDTDKHTAHLVWRAPAIDGGAPLTGYVVEHRKLGDGDDANADDDAAFTATEQDIDAGEEAEVEGLDAGADYAFRVRARNSVGVSKPSKPARAATEDEDVAGPPGPARKLDVEEPAEDGFTVTWKKPKRDGGSPLTHCVVEYAPAGAGSSEDDEADDGAAGADATRHKLDDLSVTKLRVKDATPGTHYRVKVVYGNAIGLGKPRWVRGRTANRTRLPKPKKHVEEAQRKPKPEGERKKGKKSKPRVGETPHKHGPPKHKPGKHAKKAPKVEKEPPEPVRLKSMVADVMDDFLQHIKPEHREHMPKMKVVDEGKNIYLFGTKRIQLLILHGIPYVRVGGGFVTFAEFLEKYARTEALKVSGVKIHVGKGKKGSNEAAAAHSRERKRTHDDAKKRVCD